MSDDVFGIDARNLPFWDNCQTTMRLTVLAGGEAERETRGSGMDVGAAVIAQSVMTHIGIACALMEAEGVAGATNWFRDFTQRHASAQPSSHGGYMVQGVVGHA